MGRQNLSQVVAIDSESSRKLATQAFVPSSFMSFRLPEDTTLRALQIRASGSVITTFASGTPVADDFGPLDDLISSIQVRVGGSDTIKTTNPRMAQFLQLLATKNKGERKASAGAAEATALDVTADVDAFPYGTTTQVTTIAEALTIYFECVLADYGQEKTWLNLRGVVGSDLIINTKAYSGLLGAGNTAPVVYSGSTINLDVRLIEARTVEAGRIFDVWKQTYQIETFTAQAANRVIKLNPGQKIIGVSMLARDGAAGSTTTATGLLASDKIVDQLKLTLNGSFTPRNESWKELRADNINRYGLNVPYVSNKSRIQGFAHMDLLQFKVLNTALDARYLDSVQLEVSTLAAGTYTNGATLETHLHELVAGKAA